MNINEWYDNFISHGGELYIVNYTDTYTAQYCNHDGIPLDLYFAKRILSKSSITELRKYSHNAVNIFVSPYDKIEKACHIMYLLSQRYIRFMPTIAYNNDTATFDIISGEGRCCSMAINPTIGNMNVLLFKFPGQDCPVEKFKTYRKVDSLKDLCDSIMYEGGYPQDSTVIVNSTEEHDVTRGNNSTYIDYSLSMSPDSLHKASESAWKSHALYYKGKCDNMFTDMGHGVRISSQDIYDSSENRS